MPTKPSASADSPLIIFDGVCNLCHQSVRFILRHERGPYFYFAAAQSQSGQQWLRGYGLTTAVADSFVLIENGQAYLRSDAALRVAKQLRAPWSWLRLFKWLPRGLRDGAYNWVAARRYQIFGRRDLCLLADQQQQQRFLR